MTLPQPYHALTPVVGTLFPRIADPLWSPGGFPDDTAGATATLGAALLRRLAGCRHECPAACALAHLACEATRHGPAWPSRHLPPLLEWLARPTCCSTYSQADTGTGTGTGAGPATAAVAAAGAAAITAGGEAGSPSKPGISGGTHDGPAGVGLQGDDCARSQEGRRAPPMPHTPTLGVRPWAAGLPARLQLGLRRLLAALPHCAALRGGGLEGGHGQQLLDQLLAALQPPAGAAAGATAASAAAGRGCGAGSSHAAPTAEDRGWGAGTRLGREAASWVAAAMVASRRQYQAAAGGNAVSCPGMAKDSDAFTSSADVNREAVAGTEEPDVALEPAGTGCVVGDEPGAADLRDGAASSAGGEAACSRLVLDGWWWWCPPQEDDMHACGAGNKGSDGGTGVDANDRQTTPADGEEAADAEAGRTAVPMQTDEHTGRRRRAEDGAAAEAVMEEAEGRAPGAAGGTAASTVSAPEPAGSPAAKRRRREQGPAAAGGAPAEMQPAPVLQAGDAVSELTSLLRNLQAATDPDAPSGGSPDTWQSLLAQAESCAARAAGAAAPAAVVSTALAAAAAGNTASLSLPLPPESVLVCARRLLTPALGGGAARLLLAAVVLPAVEAVERVMPKPLLEALCAAAGPHPRPLTEAVLVPAAQRRGLSAGQSQLLLKASTAGSAALPRQLQAQVLVGVCAPHVAAEWCEPQVALAQGLVEAAKQGLEQDTASAVAGGICAAARSNHLAKSVALCRLLLSLLSKAGGGVLGRAELKQLQEAAAATNTFMTKPCLAKLQELTR